MNLNNKQIFIEDKPVTRDKLLQESVNVEKQANVLDIVIELLDSKEMAFKQGDMFTLKYFIQSGGLDNLTNVLKDIQENLIVISNNICPDETENFLG